MQMQMSHHASARRAAQFIPKFMPSAYNCGAAVSRVAEPHHFVQRSIRTNQFRDCATHDHDVPEV